VTDPLPISLVAHTVFCERRAWLEAAGEQAPSLAIEQGVADHALVDARVDERTNRRRSVDIGHEDLGLVGRCDVVDIADGGLDIVEFKSAPIRRRAEITPAQVVQLALQRLCLEGGGYRVRSQRVYFTTTRQPSTSPSPTTTWTKPSASSPGPARSWSPAPPRPRSWTTRDARHAHMPRSASPTSVGPGRSSGASWCPIRTARSSTSRCPAAESPYDKADSACPRWGSRCVPSRWSASRL